MDDLIADLHIHSKYSHDSLMSPEGIVKRAKKVGLTCIAITDHGTIRGGVEAKKAGEKYGIRVVVGSEVNTDCGDIIGLNLYEEIQETKWKEVIGAIRAQGGLAMLPHPYREHCCVEEIAPLVDFIEIWNARSSKKQNDLAKRLAREVGKAAVLGSDAHVYRELGNVKVKIDLHSWEIIEILNKSYCTHIAIRQSRLISLVKRRISGIPAIMGWHVLI